MISAGVLASDSPPPLPSGSNPDMGAYENPLAAAFGFINGNVVDADTGNPITFAFIIAINSETKDKGKTFTDEAGDYDLPELPAATYWVICIKKGYKAGIKTAEVVAGETTTVDFMLTPKLE